MRWYFVLKVFYYYKRTYTNYLQAEEEEARRVSASARPPALSGPLELGFANGPRGREESPPAPSKAALKCLAGRCWFGCDPWTVLKDRASCGFSPVAC